MTLESRSCATCICTRPQDRTQVLDHLRELVATVVNESVGCGILGRRSLTEAQELRCSVLFPNVDRTRATLRHVDPVP